MQNLIIHKQGKTLTTQSVVLKTEWSEVTASELIKLNEAIDERDMLSILSGVDFSNVSNDVVMGLMSYCWKLKNWPESQIPNYFEYQGKYYFVPEVIDDKEFGAFEDARSILAEHQDTPFRAVPMLLGIYCRPRNEVYDYKKALQRAELFEGLPAPLTYSLAGFFLRRLQRLCRTLKNLERYDTNHLKLKRVWKNCRNGEYILRWMVCPAVAH